MTSLATRLSEGDIILIDGGTGTELEKRDVPMNSYAWCGAANLTHAEVIQAVHEDYIRAGADMIIANTFGTARHILEPAGLGDRFAAINAGAVKVAQQARDAVADRPIAIAGSISTTTFGREQPPIDVARTNFTDQARILADAGADLIALEMMRDTTYTRLALDAARATGLPVWIGYSCMIPDGGDLVLWDGVHELDDSLDDLVADEVSVVSIMHTLTEDTKPALNVAKAHWGGILGAYSHSGHFVMPDWQFIDMISPEDYAANALEWVEMGVQVIGGCCGIGPEHIRHLKACLPARKSSSV